MEGEIWAVKLPQLEWLTKQIRELMSDPYHNYLDPLAYGEWFESFRAVASELKELEPDLFAPLTVRELPEASGTTDFDGRGYFTKQQMRKLLEDVELATAIIRHNAPVSGEPSEAFFRAGRPFDAYVAVRDILRRARNEVLVEDPYVDSSVLDMLEPLAGKVRIRILTRNMSGDFKVAAGKFAQQHGKLEVRTTSSFHDRFMAVDGAYYMIGASLKDAGAKSFMFVQIEEPLVLGELRKALEEGWNNGTVVI